MLFCLVIKGRLNTQPAFKMTSNNPTTIMESNIDEFGRDITLKYKPCASIFTEHLERFKGMSWVEMSELLDDEEEEEQRKKDEEQRKKDEEQRKKDEVKKNIEKEELRNELAHRKKLYERGLYELEDGEELEL
jgi:hypothetical protein